MPNLLVWHFNLLDQLDSNRVGQYLILKVGVWNVMQSWKKIFLVSWWLSLNKRDKKKKEQKTKSWDHILLTNFVVHSCFFIEILVSKSNQGGFNFWKHLQMGYKHIKDELIMGLWNLQNHGNENWASLDQEIHQLG